MSTKLNLPPGYTQPEDMPLRLDGLPVVIKWIEGNRLSIVCALSIYAYTLPEKPDYRKDRCDACGVEVWIGVKQDALKAAGLPVACESCGSLLNKLLSKISVALGKQEPAVLMVDMSKEVSV